MMKQKFTVFLALLLALGTFTFAQSPNTSVTSGVVAYNNGDYEKALKYLEQGLAKESELKEKFVGKAWYYHGKALMGVFVKAGQTQDMAKLETYANAPMDAYKDYQNAVAKDDAKQKYAKLAKLEMKNLFNPMLQLGLTALNEEGYEVAIQYLDAAASIGENYLDSDYYVTYDLRGQAHLNNGDSTAATSDFNKAKSLYASAPPEKPDLYISYVYYRLALISRYADNDLDASLAYLEEGKNTLDAEFAKAQKMKDKMGDWAAVQKQYDDAKQDLSSFELDILINFPEKYNEALAKFEKAIKENPDDYIMHVAYASLLEKKDVDKAIEIYKKAIAIDDDKSIAHFNLGALYVNRAAEFATKANNTNDNAEYEELAGKMKDEFRNALPHMEASHRINPEDLGTLNALIQITTYLEMTDDFNKYKKKKEAITGG